MISHHPIKVLVNNIEVEFSSEIKKLGVYIDGGLKWGKQIGEIQRKAFGALKQLQYLKTCLPFKLRLHLVNSLVLPHLNYGSLLLTGCTDEIDTKLVEF